MEYYYKIYGLIIKSEIVFPEAYVIDEKPVDVCIKHGVMPTFINRKREKNYSASISMRKYKWFYVEKEGCFLIENGNSITVELATTADDKHIRSIILGGCLGSIMYQREIVAIHGASVVWKNKAIIVSGNSGSGKSTISTALRKIGGLFLADDTVAITSEDGCIYALPSFPQQKLCADAAIDFGYDLKELILLEENRIKYAVRVKESNCLVNKEVSIIVCLNTYDGDQVIAKEIRGSSKLEFILSNLYSYRDYKEISMNTNVFRKCLEIAQKIPIFQLQRPTDKNVVDQIAERIIELVEEQREIVGG